MKSCPACGSKKALVETNIDKYKFKESGVSSIILHGVKKFTCPDCGEEVINFGNLRALHEAIARILIRRTQNLTAEEIRYLRKWLGYSTTVFAKIIGYTPETISRYENEKADIALPYDRLIRMAVANKLQDRDYDLQKLFLEGMGYNLKWLEFRSKNGQWEEADAC